jgi:hypothetical protein
MVPALAVAMLLVLQMLLVKMHLRMIAGQRLSRLVGQIPAHSFLPAAPVSEAASPLILLRYQLIAAVSMRLPQATCCCLCSEYCQPCF